MVIVQTGNLFLREFLKDPFCDLCFVLIYINDFPDGLKSNVKLLADVTSFFSVVKKIEESASDLTKDSDTVSKWAYNWKMSINPDPKKAAQEALFFRRNSNITHSIIYFEQCSGKKS